MLNVFTGEDFAEGKPLLRTIDFWVDAAEALFNAMHYDHAEAIGYLIISRVSLSDVDVRENDHYLRALTILAEVSREKGYIREAVYFGLRLCDSYALMSNSRPILHRLRILLTVPPIPPTTEVAVIQRRFMVEDLHVLLRELRESKIRLTVQVLFAGHP
jgi:hypothetical protein